ncbi:serine--tRNA ligase [Apibacter sp. B2912]|uniref:serine--tRNA ligase n=1 Tax=Apibacter sp. B2912 TaxID=2656763 RepID=UPI00136A6550|nr:serine--tRNA ligase [Apibacter sp. B2912]MXO31714.1 serine--tRNA ligase [Apibacter sp. B2912]
MLQVAYIKDNKEKVLAGLKKRNFGKLELIDEIISLDESRKKIQFDLDSQLSEMNKISKDIGILMKEGKKDEAENAKSQTLSLKESTKKLQQSLSETEEKLKLTLYEVPNIPNDLVPVGTNEEDNLEVFKHTANENIISNALPHWELTKKYDLIDFELGVKITGAGFPVYKGKGARLQRSLVQYFLDKNAEAGYMEIVPPFVVNEASGYGTGQLPDKEGQMYYINEDKLYLIPTSEVPVTNMYRDVLLNENQLPIKLTAYSPCFRREAGSYGKDVRGLNRLHQFEKVEIVRIERPENSYEALDEMFEHVKSLLESLQLTYRILRLCGGDLGFTSAITYDFEVWSAAQERWLEVSSVSNFETFQANRLKLRYKSEGKNQLCHTLNGSSLALPRVLAALLENHQSEEGIKIPKVLVPYTGYDLIN